MSLKAGESKDVYFDLSVPETAQPGDIPYTIEASGSGLSDSVVDTIKVNPSSAYEVTATAGQTDSSASESIYVPTTIIPNMGELSVRSSATLAMYLPQALNYMIDYPYDCTEQMGSQIQAIALMDKAHLLFTNGTSTYTGKILFDGKEQKAQDIIQSRLQSIYNRQSSDGGFRLWSESYSSSLFATEEALKAFDTLKSAGYSIDETAWDKGADYLYSQYSHSNIVYSDEEIIAFAEALYTRPRYVSDLSFAKDFNSAVDRILKNETVSTGTLLSISGLSHRYGFLASQSKKIDLTLENRVIVDSRGSFLDATSGGYRDETAISNTARYIELLSMEKQNQAELPNLLRWLTLSRSKDGSWDSTENNLAVIKGFTQYLDWQPETSAVFMETNSLNGETIDTFSYKPENILTTISKTLPMSRLQFGGMNTVAFARSADGAASKGKIYYDLSLKYYLPADTMGPRDEGFAISHGFYALSDTKGQTPINQAHVGDVLREHIEFTVPVTRNDVSIEDFIPAGMEIVDTSLATEDKTLSNDVVRSAYEDQDISNSEQDVQDSTFWPDHQEWKDDRAFLYKESLSPGTYSFDYKVRALVPGKYLRLPSQISELYTPENFGRTGAGSFTIDK